MDVPEKIFKAYDIRGIYPTELNEQNLVPIVKAIYAFFLKKKNTKKMSIVLGRDMRLSSPSLFRVAKQTLVDAGAKIIDVGLVSTPTFYFAVFHYGYDAGIQITASHNPKEYNGIKFALNSPQGLIKIGKSTGMLDILAMTKNGVNLPYAEGFVTEKSSVLEEEVENALSLFGNPTIKPFKIVADPANAMGATYIDALFKKIPGELIKMNFDLDGSFPSHPPDPLDFANLVSLQKRVLEEKADFGLAPDGDGDRLFFIDEKGQVVPATIITSLVARELLKENKGATILFDIRYILTPKQIVTENGGKYDITKVGHAFITEKLNETGGIFAGESSAHYYYKTNGNAESQVATIICVLKVLTETCKTLSEMADELRRSYESGEINFTVTNAAEILKSLQKKYSNGELVTLDGVSVSFPDWRFNVRVSNTEPLLRLNIEALKKETMEQKKQEMVNFIQVTSKK